MMVCESTVVNSFALVFFNAKNVQPATLAELAGSTLQGRACGATAARSYADTFEVRTTLITEEKTPGTTNIVGAGVNYDSPTGAFDFLYQKRWAIYKVADGAVTHYFLLILSEAVSASTSVRPVKMYYIQK